MNNKQLAEMIKHLRNEKLKEQKEIKAQSKEYLKKQKFNPVHSGPEGDTPNRYAHGMEESMSRTVSSGLGGKHNPRRAAFPSNLANLKVRAGWGRENQTHDTRRYGVRFRPVSEEETEKLGSTNTKKKTQSVTITPEFEPFGKQ